MKKLILITIVLTTILLTNTFGQFQIIVDNGCWIIDEGYIPIEPLPTYNEKAVALFNTMALPLTSESGKVRKRLISNVYDSLDMYGLNNYDLRYMAKAHDIQAAMLNWANPDSFKLEPINTPIFVVDNYINGNTTGSKYFNTTYNPAINGDNFTLNNASYSLYNLDEGILNTVITGNRTATGRNTMNLAQSDNRDNYYINNGSLVVVNPTGKYGYHSLTMNNNVVKAYLNDTLQGSTTRTPVMIDNEWYISAYNNSGLVAGFSNSKITNFDLGDSISQFQHQKLKDIYDYYNNNLEPVTNLQADLLIFDGQSNQYGNATIPEDSSYRYLAAEIYDSAGNNLRYMDGFLPLSGQPVAGRRFNPPYNVARCYDSVNNKVFMTCYAYGGTQIYEDPTIFDWNANSVGEYLDNYLNSIDSTIKRMAERNVTPRYIYRIKFQGENDADNLTKANAFETNELAIINKINARYPTYNIKHILIEITDGRTYSSIVNAALNNIANSRSDVQIIPNDSFTYVEGTHIDNATQLNLGRLIFEKTYIPLTK